MISQTSVIKNCMDLVLYVLSTGALVLQGVDKSSTGKNFSVFRSEETSDNEDTLYRLPMNKHQQNIRDNNKKI